MQLAANRFTRSRCYKRPMAFGRLVSAGLERLVYTEKVGGSNPSAPTGSEPGLRGLSGEITRIDWCPLKEHPQTQK